MNIGILTYQTGYSRSGCHFYPLIKWQRKFLQEGIRFNFHNSHNKTKFYRYDVVFIDSRYIRKLVVLDKRYPDKNFIIKFIESLRRDGIKVILFDNGDGTGSREWDLIQYVDLLVKKQKLKDIQRYTKPDSYKVFLSEYDLSNNYIHNYNVCPADQLDKIRLGWNIGLTDYRYFPLSYYYPFQTCRLLNSIYKTPAFNRDFSNRPLDSTFRGKLNRENQSYSFQRNKVIEYFNMNGEYNFITGLSISKPNYLKELRRSKTVVSPFGWGEICYRDFETILAGSVLVKPDMSHIETYPDIYIKNETYVPLQWNMTDLDEKLRSVLNNYENYIDLIEKAQSIFKDSISDFPGFKKRLLSLIN